MSQWISEENPKGIGHKLARDLESVAGKAVGAMDRAPDAGSQPARLDPLILAESIAALRHVAARRGWDYDPGAHAEATCYAYEMRTLLPENPSTADVIDFGEKVAERLRQAMETGNGESGSSARAGADDRGKPGSTDKRKARAAAGAK